MKYKAKTENSLEPDSSFVRETNVGFGHTKYHCDKKQYSIFLKDESKGQMPE